MKAVKDIIKEKRLEHNLTMKELAQKVGVSEGTISRWESGEIANMRRAAMAALSQALEIPPAVLMGWDASNEISLRIDKLLSDRTISSEEWNDLKKHGITQALMNAFVNGASTPTQENLIDISSVLHISLSWLKTGKGSAGVIPQQGYYNDPEVAALAEELRTDPKRRILFDATKDLSKDDIDIVLNLIDGLKAKEGK